MSILLGDNFSYSAAKPLDGRLKYDTLANMKAVADATMYDGCMAYCSGTDKTYQWKSTNSVDETTGRWREFSSGGGGGHTIEDSEGTDLTQRDTLQFGEGFLAEDDDTNEKTVVKPDAFQEGDMDDVVDILPSGGRVVATGFTPIGTIIPVMGVHAPKNFLICDGTVYNIADYPELASYFEREFDESNHFGGDGTTTFAVPDLRGEFIRGAGTNSHSGQGSGGTVGEHQNATEIQAPQSNNDTLFEYIGNQGDSWNKRYKDEDSEVAVANGSYYRVSGTYNEASDAGGITTRPTNTSVLFCIAIKDIYTNPINDYSTEEKVIGSWIDGKTLYQKTIQTTLPTITTDGTVGVKLVDITDWNIDKVINVDGIVNTSNNFNLIDSCWNVSGAGSPQYFIRTNVDLSGTTKYFNIRCNRISLSESPAYVTIQYTKS